MSTEWLPALERELELSASDLPLVWDADFLPGAPEPPGDERYVLCEINASSGIAFPDCVPGKLAAGPPGEPRLAAALRGPDGPDPLRCLCSGRRASRRRRRRRGQRAPAGRP